VDSIRASDAGAGHPTSSMSAAEHDSLLETLERKAGELAPAR
jgi:hypothetical protein